MATIDTIADRSAGSALAGKAYFETTTNKFIVYNGSAWIELDSDGVGAVYENRWGASFDGSNDFITSDPNITHASVSSYTMSAWVNPTSFVNGGGVYQMRGGQSATDWTYNNFLRVDSATSASFLHRGSGGYTDCNYTGINLSLNTWYNFTQVWDGTNVKLYLDGALISTTTTTNTASFAGRSGYNIKFDLGRGRGSNSYPCKIDEFAWWDSDKSSSISDIYNSGVPSDLSSLNPSLYLRMGDDSSDSATAGGSISSITDSSGNGNDAVQATASSQPTFKAHALSTASLSFDASGDYLEKTFSSAPCAGAYTIGFWFNTSVNNSYLSLFENSDSLGNYNGGFRVYRFSDGSIRLATANSTGAWAHEAIAHSTSLNTWHYVVITRSAHGVSPEIYLDGVLPSGNTYGTPQTDVISATKLRIGCNQTAYSLTGYMDEVSFFNSELTGSDLTAYLSAARGTHLINDLSLSPTAYYRMGEDDGLTDGQTGISQITDASGNGNHATQATAANQPTASVGPVIYV